MDNKLDITFDTRWQELRAEYLRDPAALVEEVFGYSLFSSQLEILKNDRSRFLVTYCSGTGTSTAMALKAVLNAVFNPEIPVNVYLLPERKCSSWFKSICRVFITRLIQKYPWIKRHFKGDDLGFHYVDATQGEGINFISLSGFDAYLPPENDSPTDTLRIIPDAHYVPDITVSVLLGFCTNERDKIVLYSHADEGESRFKKMALAESSFADKLVIPAIGSKLMTKSYVDQLLKKYPVGGKEYQRRFLAEW